MQPEHSVDIQNYFDMFKRRRRIMVWTCLFVVSTAIAMAVGIPERFESKGTIMIERGEVSEAIVQTGLDRDLDTNLSIQRIKDAILTRDNLTMLLEKHNLYPELVEAGEAGFARGELRRSIAVQAVTAEDMPIGSDSTETIAFDVLVSSRSPEKARDVARNLIELFTEQHRANRTALAQNTIDFLESEAAKLESTISENEAALADFKQRNAGALPELMDMNLQVMERTERELEGIDRDIRVQQQSLNLLRSELSQISPYATVYAEDGRIIRGTPDRLQELEAEFVRIASLYGPEHPDRIRLEREISQLRDDRSSSGLRSITEQELYRKRNELEDLSQQYSADHPDAVRLRRQVASLEAELDSMSSDERTIDAAPTNPDYISTKLRVDASEEEIVALSNRRSDLRGKLNDLESRIVSTPQVEREYSELTRDYEGAVDEYNEIKEKLSVAQINLSLEIDSKGERFTVYRNANYPSIPASPNRPLIFIAAIACAFTLAIGLALLLENLDTNVRGSRDIRGIFGAPPIAAIPRIRTSADRIKQLGKASAFVTGFVLWGVGLTFILQTMP